MITYESAVSDIYPAKGTPPFRQDEQHFITEMEREGARVILEDTGREYVVKVRVAGKRQIRTGSTSAYPVKHAFEKWQEQHGAAI